MRAVKSSDVRDTRVVSPDALHVVIVRHEELDDGLDAACGGGVLKSVLAEGSSGSTHQDDYVARPHPSVFVPVPFAGLVLN